VYCVCRRDESYIGQIDLEDIRVICNRAVASPGDWSTNAESGVVMNAPALDLLHQKQQHVADCTILNNHRVAPVKQCSDSKAAAAVADCGSDNACDAGMSDVLVENGRIVLQYRNVCAGVSSSAKTTTTMVHGLAAVDRTGPGHVVCISGKPLSGKSQSDPELEYDMNDVVWKNMAASSTKC